MLIATSNACRSGGVPSIYRVADALRRSTFMKSVVKMVTSTSAHVASRFPQQLLLLIHHLILRAPYSRAVEILFEVFDAGDCEDEAKPSAPRASKDVSPTDPSRTLAQIIHVGLHHKVGNVRVAAAMTVARMCCISLLFFEAWFETLVNSAVNESVPLHRSAMVGMVMDVCFCSFRHFQSLCISQDEVGTPDTANVGNARSQDSLRKLCRSVALRLLGLPSATMYQTLFGLCRLLSHSEATSLFREQLIVDVNMTFTGIAFDKDGHLSLESAPFALVDCTNRLVAQRDPESVANGVVHILLDYFSSSTRRPALGAAVALLSSALPAQSYPAILTCLGENSTNANPLVAKGLLGDVRRFLSGPSQHITCAETTTIRQ
eukprot:TRINITY_DN6369_c0_g1_i1.p1 TRINITY_DN6369_c0_g1~~TRINITY_DN6369_c0_g1_i1.p1  ORF type:complete len:385 (-),score=10.90 TRINITY_DN6369_c0_g1_i1:70-1197(-)